MAPDQQSAPSGFHLADRLKHTQTDRQSAKPDGHRCKSLWRRRRELVVAGGLQCPPELHLAPEGRNYRRKPKGRSPDPPLANGHTRQHP